MSETIGGILDVAGIPGFLSNLDDFYAESDAEGTAWRSLMGAWWERFNSQPTFVKDLWKIAEEVALSLGEGGEQSQKVTLGKMLAERRDRVFDMEGQPSRLLLRQGDKRQGACRWQLVANQ